MKEVERKMAHISRKTENKTEETLPRAFSNLNVFYICVCVSQRTICKLQELVLSFHYLGSWAGTHFLDQAGLKLVVIFLQLPPESWGFRCAGL